MVIRRFVLVVVALALLAACGGSPAQPTEVPSPVAMPVPTETPTP